MPKPRPKRTVAPRKRRPKVKPRSSAVHRFPIVGIGASAGGLDALERLLKRIPGESGMAFLIVQHLDPKHESRLTEILARATTLPVSEVQDGMRVRPDHVYVIPPNTNMLL